MRWLVFEEARIKTQTKDHTLTITLSGDVRAFTAKQIDPVIRQIQLSGVKSAVFDVNKVNSFDITGVWIIERFLQTLKKNDISYDLEGESEQFNSIQDQIRKFKIDTAAAFHERSPILQWLEDVGRAAHKISLNAYHMVSFLGQFILTLLRCIHQPRRIKIVAVTAIVNRVGLNALPIVGMISFLLGVVLVYQGSYQLKKFGAEIFTVDLLAISFMREIGILLTAIMVAGRSGSAFAAQIGTMKLNQEIDALLTFGIDPIEVLVVPRVIALVIVMPLLAFYADIIGLIGGAYMSYIALDISFNQFTAQFLQAITKWTFWVGIIKAPFFGFAIALTGCFEGLQVQGDSTSVGKKTTKSVVESIFIVLVLDAIFSILFTKLNI